MLVWPTEHACSSVELESALGQAGTNVYSGMCGSTRHLISADISSELLFHDSNLSAVICTQHAEQRSACTHAGCGCAHGIPARQRRLRVQERRVEGPALVALGSGRGGFHFTCPVGSALLLPCEMTRQKRAASMLAWYSLAAYLCAAWCPHTTYRAHVECIDGGWQAGKGG